MTDIVERLRDMVQYAIRLSDPARSTCAEAADEIERLRVRIKELENGEFITGLKPLPSKELWDLLSGRSDED